MRISTPGTRPPAFRRSALRALPWMALGGVLASGCEDAGPGLDDLPFGRSGRVRVEVSTPLAKQGELRQVLTWRSGGTWELSERILYKGQLGDETVRRSSEDSGTLSRRYAIWIQRVNEPTPVQLFLGDALPASLKPTCDPLRSSVTIQIVDAQRADSVAWTRCAEGSLATLSSEFAGPEPAAGRVIEAAKLLRDATLPLDRRFVDNGGYAYTGSMPFRTIDRGEQGAIPLLIPRVIEDGPTWSGFWAQHTGGARPLPAVDFTSEVVIVAAVGNRQEAGDSVEVRRVLPVDFGTQVSLRERRPGDFCTPAPRSHSPFHIVVAPLVPRPIYFSLEPAELVPCG